MVAGLQFTIHCADETPKKSKWYDVDLFTTIPNQV